MQPKHLQALIDIQANTINRLHNYVAVIKEATKDAMDANEKEYCYKHISKLTRRIAKLAELQRVLKDALSSEIFYEKYIANDCDDDYIIGSNL